MSHQELMLHLWSRGNRCMPIDAFYLQDVEILKIELDKMGKRVMRETS